MQLDRDFHPTSCRSVRCIDSSVNLDMGYTRVFVLGIKIVHEFRGESTALVWLAVCRAG